MNTDRSDELWTNMQSKRKTGNKPLRVRTNPTAKTQLGMLGATQAHPAAKSLGPKYTTAFPSVLIYTQWKPSRAS
ncbi:hypothetical protein EVAR_85255_1 [Eumeta japonica]|uniref:Uncharacterized protein n=1 Tax=Eumeta variegata TaxID=151549 RepID=A0A4C1VZ49_EUMVA|nr:hypothetical protein EVAR_85255_1 [Eumeta japonica]